MLVFSNYISEFYLFREEFERYFYSHYTFVVRQKQATDTVGVNDTAVAAFYIKPSNCANNY